MDSRKTQSRQQHQLFGQIKGATKIVSETSTEQDQINKQRSSMVDNSGPSGINPFPGGEVDISSNNILIQPVINMHPANTSTTTTNEIIPSSSYNLQACSNTDSVATLALTASIPALVSTNNVTNKSHHSTINANNTIIITDNSQQIQLQAQTQNFKSPQILPYDIKSLFECPICFDYAVPPIYQCQNGHLVCQSCSGKISHCPTCRVPITEPSIRNLQLDRLANTFQFPCKYNFNGCQWKSYWFKKREHEENCDYISYSCPCPGSTCKWTGLLPQVMPHLREHHKSITTLNGEDIVFLATDINLKGAVDWVMIQSCFNQHFLLVLEKQELKYGQQQFFAIVQLLGPQKEAEKFRYRLELNSCVSGQTKRLQWEATPRSILDGIQTAISNYDCLVFDSRMAQQFLSPIKKELKSDENVQESNQSENLGINVTIERSV